MLLFSISVLSYQQSAADVALYCVMMRRLRFGCRRGCGGVTVKWILWRTLLVMFRLLVRSISTVGVARQLRCAPMRSWASRMARRPRVWRRCVWDMFDLVGLSWWCWCRRWNRQRRSVAINVVARVSSSMFVALSFFLSLVWSKFLAERNVAVCWRRRNLQRKEMLCVMV